jgi:three-Cys-motif partner protein
MTKKKYEWEIGQAPPILHVHSLAKHEVLRAYLSRYVKVLAANPRIDRLRLTLVDGFSGGGHYRHEHTSKELSGSPLIFLESTRGVEAEIRVGRSKPFVLDAHYMFMEEDPQTLAYLRALLVERGYRDLLVDGRIQLYSGAFADKVDEVVRFIQRKGRTGRSIFLLDQSGYKDVPFGLLSRLFATLPQAEVILTFAVDALADYLGNNPTSEQIVKDLGFGDDLDLRDFAKTKGASDRRFFIQSRLSPVMHRRSGARFFTPFFIVSRESNRDYWLVHLSMHERARDEMARLHWEFHNHFRHNGGAGLDMLGYDPKSDNSLTGQEDFDFDDKARQRSQDQLRIDLPEVLMKHRDGIPFGELIRTTCNSTPATTDIYQGTLDALLGDKDIVVSSSDGSQHRTRGHRIKSGDIIRVSTKPTLFFRKPR